MQIYHYANDPMVTTMAYTYQVENTVEISGSMVRQEQVLEGDGGGLEIGFNNKYMMDALKAASVEKVTLELSSPITPCIIVPAEGEENFLFMVLPVRLKADY